MKSLGVLLANFSVLSCSLLLTFMSCLEIAAPLKEAICPHVEKVIKLIKTILEGVGAMKAAVRSIIHEARLRKKVDSLLSSLSLKVYKML